jgi:membrane-bound lytic murein transglycosylase A
MISKIFSLILIFITLNSCFLKKKAVIKNNNFTLTELDFSQLYNWQQDNHLEALQAFLHSCHKMANLEQKKSMKGSIINITPAHYQDVCQIAEVVSTLSNQQAKNFFENWFRVFKIEGKQENKLFTGYYEATLFGSYKKDTRYKYAVYGLPNNKWFNFKTTRQQINDGALNNKKLELLYVDNAVDLFFTHIQGSATIILPNNHQIKLVYAGKNNQQFVAIGNYLLNNRILTLENINPLNIKQYLQQNPEIQTEIFNLNPSYIFFSLSNKKEVLGSFGVPLTSERSLAIDDDIISYGSLLWVAIKKQNFHKLMLAQDTGSAIKGLGRGDIFFGSGAKAEEKASAMYEKGEYYLLIPNNFFEKKNL